MRVNNWLKGISLLLFLPLVFSFVWPAGSASAKPSISPQTEPPPDYFHHYWDEAIYMDGSGLYSSNEWTTNNQTDVSISIDIEGQGELTVSYEVYSDYSGWTPMHAVTFTESGNYDYKMGYYHMFPEYFYRYRITYDVKKTDEPVIIYGEEKVEYYDRWIPTGGGW